MISRLTISANSWRSLKRFTKQLIKISSLEGRNRNLTLTVTSLQGQFDALVRSYKVMVANLKRQAEQQNTEFIPVPSIYEAHSPGVKLAATLPLLSAVAWILSEL